MFTESPKRVYGLSFLSVRGGEERRYPELVVTIDSAQVPFLGKCLERFGNSRVALSYLKESKCFEWPDGPELFEGLHPMCGYRSCGYIVTRDDEWELHFALRKDALKELVLSLNVLFDSLGACLAHTGEKPNRTQLLTIRTICDPKGGMHAHSMYGEVYPAVRDWLVRAQTQGTKVGFIHTAYTLPDVIKEAMQETWRVVAPPNLEQYADECSAVVSSDARFSLSCFGNACDVSIYPDTGWISDTSYFCQYSCHNLDAAHQQLTHIAGLAKLYELVEKGEG